MFNSLRRSFGGLSQTSSSELLEKSVTFKDNCELNLIRNCLCGGQRAEECEKEDLVPLAAGNIHIHSEVPAKTIISVSLLSPKVGAAAGWEEGSRMEIGARSFSMENTCKNHGKQLA